MEVLMGKSSNIYKLDSLGFYPVAMFDYRRVARLYDTDIGNFLQVCSLDCTYLERITPAKGTMIPKYDLQTYSSHFQWPLISRLVSIKMFMLYHVISTQQHDLGQKNQQMCFQSSQNDTSSDFVATEIWCMNNLRVQYPPKRYPPNKRGCIHG